MIADQENFLSNTTQCKIESVTTPLKKNKNKKNIEVEVTYYDDKNHMVGDYSAQKLNIKAGVVEIKQNIMGMYKDMHTKDPTTTTRWI